MKSVLRTWWLDQISEVRGSKWEWQGDKTLIDTFSRLSSNFIFTCTSIIGFCLLFFFFFPSFFYFRHAPHCYNSIINLLQFKERKKIKDKKYFIQIKNLFWSQKNKILHHYFVQFFLFIKIIIIWVYFDE